MGKEETSTIGNRVIRGACYAGIGSRKISDNVFSLCFSMGKAMAVDGWHLRATHSAGCSVAFEQGAEEEHAGISVFLPWKSYGNEYPLPIGCSSVVISSKVPEIDAVCMKAYPDYKNISGGIRKLMRRYVACLLGTKLDTPVRCVMCWTPVGEESPSGAYFALQVAKLHNIPIINLATTAPDKALEMAMECS